MGLNPLPTIAFQVGALAFLELTPYYSMGMPTTIEGAPTTTPQ